MNFWNKTYLFRILPLFLSLSWTGLCYCHLHSIFGVSIYTSWASSSANYLLLLSVIRRYPSWNKTMRCILSYTSITFITHWQRTCTTRSSYCNSSRLWWNLHIALSLFEILAVRDNTLSSLKSASSLWKNTPLTPIIKIEHIIIVSVLILIILVSIMTVIFCNVKVAYLVSKLFVIKHFILPEIIATTKTLVGICSSIHEHRWCAPSICNLRVFFALGNISVCIWSTVTSLLLRLLYVVYLSLYNVCDFCWFRHFF